MKSILLVGRSNDERGVLAAILRKKGFHVVEAENAVSGEAGQARVHEIDLIIAGLQDRAEEGILAQVREKRPRTPVLVINGCIDRFRKREPGRESAAHGTGEGMQVLSRELDRRIRLALNREGGGKRSWDAPSKVA
jgi:DNA-binding response OmpR family regulator